MARGGDARERTVTLAGEGARGGGGDATRSGERRSGEQQDGDGEDDGEDDGDKDGDGDGDKDKDGDKDVLHVLIVPARVAFGFCVEGERGRARERAGGVVHPARARVRPGRHPRRRRRTDPGHPRGRIGGRGRGGKRRGAARHRERGGSESAFADPNSNGAGTVAFARSAARRRELERRTEASATAARFARQSPVLFGTPAYEDLWARAKALGAIQAENDEEGEEEGEEEGGSRREDDGEEGGGEARVGDLAARVSDLAARAESIVSDEDDDDEEDDDELSLDLDVDPFERHSVRTVAGEAENAPERDLLSELD